MPYHQTVIAAFQLTLEIITLEYITRAEFEMLDIYRLALLWCCAEMIMTKNV
jgi:hypothetical protein